MTKTGLGRVQIDIKLRTIEAPIVLLGRTRRTYLRGEPIPIAELEVMTDAVSVVAGLTRERLEELVKLGQEILANPGSRKKARGI